MKLSISPHARALVKVKLMVMKMKLLLWKACFQEQQPAVLLLIAMVLLEVCRTKYLCKYRAYSQLWLHSNMAEGLNKRSYGHACCLLLDAIKIYLYCFLSLPGCTMILCMSMYTSSPMGCMLQICIHQALVAEEVIHEGKTKSYFKPGRLLPNLTLMADNVSVCVCVHCFFFELIQMTLLVAHGIEYFM